MTVITFSSPVNLHYTPTYALDRRVSLVIGSFESALGQMRGVRQVMEPAVSKRSAEALVEEQEQQGDLDAFSG